MCDLVVRVVNVKSEPITVHADKVLITLQPVTVIGPLPERLSENMSVSQLENNEEVKVSSASICQRTT